MLGTAAAGLYTAPAGKTAVVKRAVFCNSTATATGITVSVSRAGGGATALISAQQIPANSTYLAPELANLVLNAGDSISAGAGAAATISAVMSGFTI